MASRKDMQDIMGLPAGEAPKATIQKKPKAPQQKRPTGINREVAALMGERAPPIAIIDENKTYRHKRIAALGPAKPWIQTSFMNPARKDDLMLRHWRRKQISRPAVDQESGEDGDTKMEDETENQGPQIETEYEFAKYNIQIEGPQYTDEQYEAYLRSDEWSKEETDYLVELVKEYYQRWAVIADRYDWRAAEPESHTDANSDALALPFSQTRGRTMEDMKARYYSVCAKCMEIQTPISNMDTAEFTLHETLTKFDPILETQRKRLAAALLSRSLDEVKEEEFLLAELQRINISAQRLDAERNEIRARLETAPSAPTSTSSSQFQSSQALQALFQQLFQQDRSKKRASGAGGARLSLNANDLIGSPAGTTPATNHRDSITSNALNKKSNLTGPAAQPGPTRSLPPRAEARFGISTHDRLTNGVTFRSDKMLKLRQAKSQVQTQKIAAVLAELGVPDLIALPTTKVCESFERLISRVGKLLDLRKLREKEEGEERVLMAEKEKLEGPSTEARNGAEATKEENVQNGTEARSPGKGSEGSGADADGDADELADAPVTTKATADGRQGNEEGAGEGDAGDESGPKANGAGHKRSASVLSTASSSKSNKRPKK